MLPSVLEKLTYGLVAFRLVLQARVPDVIETIGLRWTHPATPEQEVGTTSHWRKGVAFADWCLGAIGCRLTDIA
jgi:hypothetical protein